MSNSSKPLVVVDSVLDLIGHTDLVRIRRLGRGRPRAEVWGKMEQQNPGGCTKDRVALAMVLGAERSGALASAPGARPGTVVVASSGNLGISLALVCAAKGYRCIVAMPESMTLERRQLLEALGAEIVRTPAEEQMQGAMVAARAIAERAQREGGAVYFDQFTNPAGEGAHASTTGPEIVDAMADLSFDAFVAGVGSGATLSGVARALARMSPHPRIVAVEPDSCATISRGERGPTKIQGLGAGFVPESLHRDLVDEVRTVSDADAWNTKVALAREEGLLVGISAGAAACAALRIAEELGPGKNVVALFNDTGERYFSLGEYFDPPPLPRSRWSNDEVLGTP